MWSTLPWVPRRQMNNFPWNSYHRDQIIVNLKGPQQEYMMEELTLGPN